jgi:Tol biopolymer transport system component
MIRHCCHKSFLILSFWLLVSCSNGSLPKTTSTPQLPLNQAETILSSPDGKWIAYFFDDKHIDYRLSVANFDDTVVWNVNQTNLAAEAWFTPYRWSQDSRYLYFNIYVAIDGGFIPFYQGAGLQRLDVLNGEVSEILSSGDLITLDPTHYRWQFPAFSLSPKDDKLAYIKDFDNEAQGFIRDMKTGKERSLSFKGYSSAGSIIWSPQQDQLVLAVAKGNWSCYALLN